MLYAVLGVVLGQLTRSIPAASFIVLVSPLVIEPVISALPELDVLSWLRGIVLSAVHCGMQLVTAGLSAASQNGDSLGRWEGRRGVRHIHLCFARHRMASVRASRRLTHSR